MTRPDVEGLRHEDDAEWVTELLDWICALEAARDKVLPHAYNYDRGGCWAACPRCDWEAALARWAP